MRTPLLALSLACALGAPFANAAEGQRPEVAQQAQRLQPKVLAWRRDIHQHPELGNRETRTSKLVADHLRALGLEVKTGIATTGVIAVLKGGKPGRARLLRSWPNATSSAGDMSSERIALSAIACSYSPSARCAA